MNEWQDKFDENTLNRGRTLCVDGRVDLKEVPEGYQAAVRGRTRIEVTVRMKDGVPTRVSCHCPVSKSGRHCEHMAAVLYAIEARKSAEEESVQEKELLELWRKRDEELLREEQHRTEAAESGKKVSGSRRRTKKGPEAEKQEREPMRQELAKQEPKGQAEELAEEKLKGQAEKPAEEKPEGQMEEPLKRRRVGRPKKQPESQAAEMREARAEEPPKRRGPGRPRKKPEGQIVEPTGEKPEDRKAEQSENRGAESVKENSEDQAEDQAEREARRQARELRKAEKARQEEMRRMRAEEKRRQEAEQRQAEEERREAIRKKKAEEKKVREEKRRQEQEMIRQQEEKRRQEQETMRQQEEKHRQGQETMRQQEEKRRQGQETMRQQEEKRRQEQETMRQQEETRRREAEERGMTGQQEAADQEKAERTGMERKADEREYTLLGSAWEEAGEREENGESIAKLEQYRYFDDVKIRASVEIPPKVRQEGERLRKLGQIELKNIVSGFDRGSGEILGQADARAKDGKKEYFLRAIFSRDEVRHFTCECPKCRKDYYASWYSNKTNCPYKAGMLTALTGYLREHNLGDSTDQKAMLLMGAFQKKRAHSIVAEAGAKEESLRLAPRVTRKDGCLSVSFRVGSGKLFVVKKLGEFCQCVKEGATAVYGSSTQLNHNIANFTEESRSWIRFINQIVQEELVFEQRLMDSRGYYGRAGGVGSSLQLFGWRLDEFYDRMGSGVDFEDKDGGEKRKGMLYRGTGNPQVTMRISAVQNKGEKEFHGIQVTGSLPELYRGTDASYYIAGEKLFRTEKAFVERIEPLANLSSGDQFSFRVGRNHMAEFYYGILPQLSDLVAITETEPEKFREYLPPEAQFIFYLDGEEGDLTCRAYARYGEREVAMLDVLRVGHMIQEPFRDEVREEEALYLAMQWFPEIDEEKEELCCGGDEARIYEVMAQGVEKLMEIGEVHCTRRFLGYHVVNQVKVSVGVSVSSGMLDLAISTEDIPQSELLDLLQSFRVKKKYYRLKDGSFVNLEDSSLEMLAELVDSMHLKPKDFIKGKMHLPMYRTLYLDKMLEENESVYSQRDSHFRRMVKGFKTVKDADFEEPASLTKIMRNYQKNGYKWLRTLESWGFGGILADDMGLGKTLQVIAVLLAAKQEGKKGTSLVISPASLVFNWGEEFAKFAPELSVSLVTGSQEERQAKIEAWQEYDVLVTSYDLLKRDIPCYEDKEFQYQVIDEAQYIKNHTTAAAKAVKVVKGRQRYALTGTPIENRLSELWSIFDYLMPGFLYGYDVFKREIEIPVVKNQDETAMRRLQRMVGPFILRRLKEEVLKDLPEKLEEIRYVRFGREQQRLYDGQVLHMREILEGQDDSEFRKNKMKLLAELTRLRQICCDPGLCFENYGGEAAKVEAALQLVQSGVEGGHRILLFSQFTSMLEILEGELTKAGLEWYTITGATPKERRLQLVKQFNEGAVPVFLISLKAGGVGLNLTGADVVIHYDPWWNLAVQNQATDRAHRIGQTRKVTVYKLIAKNSIEEKIQRLQETKRDLAEQVMSGELGQLGSMSREELLELLDGKAEAVG